jgi:hypothetical protein
MTTRRTRNLAGLAVNGTEKLLSLSRSFGRPVFLLSLVLVVLMYLVPTSAASSTGGADSDFANFLQEKQRQEAEETAHRERLARHEVSTFYTT